MEHFDFCFITGSEEMSRQFMRANGLLADSPVCNNPACQAQGVHMTFIRQRANRPNVYHWRCRRCRRVMGERVGSLFEGSNVPLTKLLSLLHYWAHAISVKATAAMLQLTEKTVIEWHKSFRSICRWWIRRNPRQIGGRVMQNGVLRPLVVEIDEALVAKRKNNQGRVIEQRWIFGGYCAETGEGFLQLVQRRDTLTLLPLIIRHIRHGSMIYSDLWQNLNPYKKELSQPCCQAYNRIADIRTLIGGHVRRRYRHMGVNHSRFFVDPQTGCCTNHVENFWCQTKRRLKSMQGVANSTLKGHLHEFIWRHRNHQDGHLAFNAFIRHISERYPLV